MKTKDVFSNSLLFFLLIVFTVIKGQADNYSTIKNQIDSMRIEYNFPAVAYGVIRNDSILLLDAVGYRNIETKDKVQATDYFHIGSNTKSFTAFLAGKLVEDGLIAWNTKFFDLYPELKDESNPVYYNITLQQLLSHRARLINFKEDSEVFPIITNYENSLGENISLAEKRYLLIENILKLVALPEYDQCDDSYSNAGFITASLMLEKVSGKTWEELITNLSTELNFDLHIGWPDEYSPNQPKGHINPKDWVIDIEKELIPLPFALKKYHYFNQFGLLTSPSGNISITLNNFLEYLQLFISGMNGKDNYIKSETYNHILTSFQGYTLGWWIEDESSPLRFTHRGSNGTFFSFAGFSPERKLGVVVMINTYKEEGLTEMIQLISSSFVD